MNTTISVIVPIFNSEDYLQICANQILKQTFQDYELLLIDDGSSDNSLQICDELASKDSRVRVIHQENTGVSGARNTGLAQAKGKYISFIDSDDMIAPDYLKYLLMGMREDNTILSMCSHTRVRNYDFKFSTPQETFSRFVAKDCAERLLLGSFPVSTCGVLFEKSLIGEITFPIGVRNNEDKLFLYQYLLQNERGSVAFSNEKLYGYMVREGSASRNDWNTSLDIVTMADQMFSSTVNLHPEWTNIAELACIKARLDTMKYILRSPQKYQGNQVYVQLKEELKSFGFPKFGSSRLKIEYLFMLSRPAYKLLIELYYRIYDDEKRFKRNEKKTRQE